MPRPSLPKSLRQNPVSRYRLLSKIGPPCRLIRKEFLNELNRRYLRF